LGILSSNYICTVDLSSSKIAALVAIKGKKGITDIFFESAASRGIKRGTIIDSIELISCIEGVLGRLKSKSGVNIKYIYANVSGQDASMRHTQAIMPLAERGNKVITLSDVEKVNDQARILGSSLEEEIIDQMPFSYSVDTAKNIINPVGLYSHRLEVDLYLVLAKLSFVQTLTRSINQAGFEIKDLFFSSLATSRAVFNDDTKKGLNVFCDIGSDITEILIFNNGMLKNIEILSMGGDDLTRQIADDLKMSLDLAEEVKKSYASIGELAEPLRDKEILIKKDNIYKPLRQGELSDAVTKRAKLMSESIRERIEKSASPRDIDSFLVCGRTVLLEGLLEMMESSIGVPLKLAHVASPEIAALIKRDEALAGSKYLTYLASLGMLIKAMDEDIPKFISAFKPSLNPVLRVINKFKEVYQEYF